jgi:hypothetical protein
MRRPPSLRRRESITTHGNQHCDPVLVAQAIIAALQAETSSFRLILGRSAVQRIRTEMDAQRREIDAWGEVAIVHY